MLWYVIPNPLPYFPAALDGSVPTRPRTVERSVRMIDRWLTSTSLNASLRPGRRGVSLPRADRSVHCGCLAGQPRPAARRRFTVICGSGVPHDAGLTYYARAVGDLTRVTYRSR